MQHEAMTLTVEGELAGLRSRVENITNTLATITYWEDAANLQAQCQHVLRQIDTIHEQLEYKLVVTIVGGGGIGKSTLFNALAMSDDLSKTGKKRPTTRKMIVHVQNKSDAKALLSHIDHDDVRMVSSVNGGEALANIILVDTPDTDSSENEPHHQLLKNIIRRSDVILCCFKAENPKRWDNLNFLKPFIEQYPHEHLYIILTFADRQDETELKEHIVPDFKKHLAKAWGRNFSQLFSISARRYLPNPNWETDAKPLHQFDQFEELRNEITGSTTKPSAVVSSRLARAHFLKDTLFTNMAHSFKHLAPLQEVRKEIGKLEHQAKQEALTSLINEDRELRPKINAMFYSRLAANWWGPIGWLVAIWFRLIALAASWQSFRSTGNPAALLSKRIYSLAKTQPTSKNATDNAYDQNFYANAILRYRDIFLQKWPPIADRLVQLGFSNHVRDLTVVMSDQQVLEDNLSSHWLNSMVREVERRTAILSSLPLQLLFNAAPILLAIIFCLETVNQFLAHHYLPAEYFLHGLVALGLTLLISFFLFQFIVRAFSSSRLLKKVCNNFTYEIEKENNSVCPLIKEIDRLLRLF